MFGLTQGEIGIILFLLVVIVAGGKLRQIADALGRAYDWLVRRGVPRAEK